MKILIKERECTYVSDFPDGWKFSSGDYFKFPVMIKANPPFTGEYPCFIKRFEKKEPSSISGWELLVKLEHKFETNLARVHDIASVEEKGKRIYYVVYEYLEGYTLDNLIASNVYIDLAKLTNDLFLALASLHKFSFWFADFVEKNILREINGKFVLMDLDSAQPFTKLPHDDMDVSKDYWALVFDYYKNILGFDDLKVSDLPGLCFNQLQVIFMVLRLKLSYDPTRQQYRHGEIFHQLPAELDRIDPSFRELFIKVYHERKDPRYKERAEEISKLIVTKIIPYQPSLEEPANPEIEEFTADPDIIEKGNTFELRWKVRNATSIELYKNDMFDSRFSPREKGITKTIFYDGTASTVSYKLVVFKEDKRVESTPVNVRIRDENHKSKSKNGSTTDLPVTDPDQQPDNSDTKTDTHTEVSKIQDPGRKSTQAEKPTPPPSPIYIGFNEIIKRYIKGISIALAALFILAVILVIKLWPSQGSKEPVISSVNPRVAVDSPVVINGKNFPADQGSVKVFINKMPVTIQTLVENRLAVEYPKALDLAHSKEISTKKIIIDTVDVVIGKDTLHAELRVLKNLTFPTQNAGSDGAQTEEGTEAVAVAGTLTAREKRILDSIGVVKSIRSIREKSGIIDPVKQTREAAEKRITDSITLVSSQRN